MNEIKRWNKKEYNIFLKNLYSRGDTKYKKFISGLGIDDSYLIGIPVPECKRIAKEICQTDYMSFIKYNSHKTFEERLIHGLVIGDVKEDFDTIQNLFSDYITYIDNWSLCDVTVANMHIWKKNLDNGLNFVINCINNDNDWSKRVGYVLLLDYYISKEYLDLIFKLCNKNKSEHYYVKMAIAWLISICYIKYPVYTFEYLKNNKLDDWTHNKAIQKIRESRRVSISDKDMLLQYKRTSTLC